MTRRIVFFAVLFVCLAVMSLSHAQNPAPTPPMGWNSWDAYGLTIDEADFKANATVLAGLKQFGWQYAVIDEGWYMENPFGADLAERNYLLDANGILIPVASRFPTAADGAGFKPLADWVHAQGLKFGIHIVRGIPRQAVKENLPIAGSKFHAADAADTAETCPWDDGNYGVADNAAGQAYYDSMLKLYAGWGLDYIKVDCISDHPYRPTEIRQIAKAIRKTGRPIVLSLSPGPTQLEHAAEVAELAQMWRISDDHWDGWTFPRKPNGDVWPYGTREEFDLLGKWFMHTREGAWPDADMLPFGWLGPHPGWGEPRQSRLTHDEQQTEFTLWAIARSPLILGANLTRLDEFTRSLVTNQEVIDVNQKAYGSHPVTDLPEGFENVRVWESNVPATDCAPLYIAFFNLGDKPVTLSFEWDKFAYCQWAHISRKEARNLWDGSRSKGSGAAVITLNAHGSSIYLVQ
ncbi:MAG: glycoside hydrolase family 27 protein [Terracidiphilus sp.]